MYTTLRRNGDDAIDISNSGDLRADLAETRAALINADRRMKSLEYRIQETSALLETQLEVAAKSQEDAQKALASQQFTQTMLLSFIAFTAGAGLLLSQFKGR
jgi:hypothetical protein